MPIKKWKMPSHFGVGLKEARLAQPPRKTVGRKKKVTAQSEGITPHGWRRLICYLTPDEFRELQAISEAEGVALSVCLRGMLRTVVDVKEVEKVKK